MAQFSTIVNASFETTWNHLILKIEHPENFVPGISNVYILEKTADYIVREMMVTTADATSVLKEKITFIPYKVRFELLEHPKLEGYVDNDIRFISDTETEMTFTINWKDKTTQTAINNLDMVKKAVLKTKTHIETHL